MFGLNIRCYARKIIRFFLKKALSIVVLDRSKTEISTGDFQKVRDIESFDLPKSADKASRSRFDGLIKSPVQIKEFGLTKLKKVTLVGPYCIPVLQNGKIYVESYGDSFEKIVFRTIVALGFIRLVLIYVKILLRDWRHADPVESLFFLTPRSGFAINQPNYGHWIFENLPQLEAYIAFKLNCPVILNSDPNQWQIESIEMIDASINVMTVPGEIATVETLFIPSFIGANSTGYIHNPKARNFVRDRFFRCYAQDSSSNVRYFIHRQNKISRRISNFVEVRRLLVDEFSFVEFETEKLSFKEEGRLFRRASVILTPHGSAVSKMIFANPDCKVIELSGGEHWKKDVFFRTAMELGHQYYSVPVEVAQRDSSLGNTFEEWKVDVDLLRYRLKRILGNYENH